MRRTLLPLLLLTGLPAQAQDCAPARLLATVQMHSAEPESNIRTVPVTLNGVTRHMVLDTGGAITQLSKGTIEELDLPMQSGGAAVYDINGRVSHHFATVKEFGFGDLHRNDAALMVWPESTRPYAGELAQDMLQPYDVDVDFASGMLKMYAKDHCPGPIGWTPTARAEMHNKGWHLHIPVTLDGHVYDAIFDTGSRHTIMRLPAARRDFGLDSDSPGMEPYRAINGDPFLNGYIHAFSKLSFGGITVDHPEVMIVPDVMNRNADRSPMARNRAYLHNADLILPELSLGMDVLKHLHLYMAFGEQALYVAQNDAAPGPLPRMQPNLDALPQVRHREGMTTLPKSNPQAILGSLLDAARKAGADAADALYVEGVSSSVSYRLGKLEDVERAESYDLGLRVFVGQKIAFVSSTDFSTEALGALPGRAVAMARLAPEDKFAGLAPRDRLAASVPQLDLEDAAEPGADLLVERARDAEGAALAVTGVTNSEGGGASFSRNAVALATSTGFYGRYAATSHGIGVAVLAGEGTGMERDYDHASARHAADLRSPEEIGRTAGEKAVRRLNPRSMKSQSVPVVFHPDEAAGLLGHFAGAISGAAIARGVSFLKDRMGTEVFAPGISVIDDPHRVRGLRSKPFDGEGVANTRRALIENGQLTSWLLDCASARQLGMETTGHAARGTGGPPSPSSTNLYLEAGKLSVQELIADIKQGFYVTELMGMGVNGVTGDYSRGAAGFWIENGEIAFPVSEVTIAGNLKDMFTRLAAASDLEFRHGVNAPTVRIEGMTLAGA